MKDFQLRNDTKLLFRSNLAGDLSALIAGKQEKKCCLFTVAVQQGRMDAMQETVDHSAPGNLQAKAAERECWGGRSEDCAGRG